MPTPPTGKLESAGSHGMPERVLSQRGSSKASLPIRSGVRAKKRDPGVQALAGAPADSPRTSVARGPTSGDVGSNDKDANGFRDGAGRPAPRTDT